MPILTGIIPCPDWRKNGAHPLVPHTASWTGNGGGAAARDEIGGVAYLLVIKSGEIIPIFRYNIA